MAVAASNPFNSIPIETTQHIASLLEYDNDVCNFRLICRSTLDAVDADNCSFWRRRFLSHFEDPSWMQVNNIKYKSTYQNRRSLLKNGASFKHGATRSERQCLELLRDLAVESFAGKDDDPTKTYESLNLHHIKRFLCANDLLQIIFEPAKKSKKLSLSNTRRSQPDPSANSLIQTLQVLFAPMLLSFEPHLECHHYGYPDSQAAVYATPTAIPMFGGAHGLDIDMEFILHNINFWKYHMIREVEQTLYYPFCDLEDDERPRWWNSKLQQGSELKLGKHWKGSYAYIERYEISDLRARQEASDQIQDNFAGEETSFSFQDMRLQLIDDPHNNKDFPWPEQFERVLKSLTPPPPLTTAKTRAQKRCASPEEISHFKPQSFRFDGEGQDVTESFLASGWLNPLPPQNGIPGWRRMTMMKYFEDDGDVSGIDLGALWAYEGVVLPGGQIMLGRWWSPGLDGDGDGEEVYSGPFILWCVDVPRYDELDEVDEEVEMGMDKTWV